MSVDNNNDSCNMVNSSFTGNLIETIKDVVDRKIYDCRYSPDGEYFAMISRLKLLLFSSNDSKLVKEFSHHKCMIHGVAFSKDNKFLATCSYDKKIFIYNLEDLDADHTELENDSFLCTIAFCPNDSKIIYSGDHNGFVKKWNIDSSNNNPVAEKKIHDKWIWRLAVSENGQRLITGSLDRTAKLIDVSDDEFNVLHTFSHDNHVRSVAFLPDSEKKIVACGDQSSKVKLWNMETGELVHQFDLEAEVYCLRFLSPKHLLVMSGDGYICCYELDNFGKYGEINCRISSYMYAFDVFVSSDKKQLAVGACEDLTIKIYGIDWS
eukprot:TRINITY_DN2118_c0_g1_i1.p1 TRINITY_DN2118_c0_g1~~TRINITY_DN2118_c0_g1_i1.p1  ORF type:complete len:334 (+),score=76.11 TRINITY_DN2118_c0_g1_i1:37-1002(+)